MAARPPARLVATLVLLGMVFLVAMSNNARDSALDGERHAYDVTLLSRDGRRAASPAPKPRSAASCSTRRSSPAATSITTSGGLPGTRSSSSTDWSATIPTQRAAGRRAASDSIKRARRGTRARRARRGRASAAGRHQLFLRRRRCRRPGRSCATSSTKSPTASAPRCASG